MTDIETKEAVSPADASSQDRSEGGYILVQAALLIIPLMIFASFATDIGYWYAQGQQSQKAADAAALAGAPLLPDLEAARAEALLVAERNGFVDATPDVNDDFLTGPLPQIEVTTPGPGALEVRIRRSERSFLGQLVLDSITVERFAVAKFAPSIHLGNPTSVMGSGTVPDAELGVPNDSTWLAVTGYCSARQHGDQFMTSRFGGPTGPGLSCSAPSNIQPNTWPNPLYNQDAYAFVVETQPGSGPIDVDVFEPGKGCDNVETYTAADQPYNTRDSGGGPLIEFRVYGPSVTHDHRGFIENNTPILTTMFPRDACYVNGSPGGSNGWYAVAQNLPSEPNGGFYYVLASSRSTDQSPEAWSEVGPNNFSIKATPSAQSQGCVYSVDSPFCPKLYGLDWIPLWRNMPNNETDFFLTEIGPEYAGTTMIIHFFDAAEGIANIQFADSNDTAMPFRWRYVDESIGGMDPASGLGYAETEFVEFDDFCNWNGSGGQPCLITINGASWNDRMVEIAIDIPADYTCGADCWWKIRYNTGGSPSDRSNWTISYIGDPVQLIE